MTAKDKKIGSWLLSLVLTFQASTGPLLSASSEQPDAAGATKLLPRLMLSGAVIRYDSLSQQLTREQWLEILDQISSLGIKTIVIQHHHFVPHQNGNSAPAEELDFLPKSEAVTAKASAKVTAKSAVSGAPQPPVKMTAKVQAKVRVRVAAKMPAKTLPAVATTGDAQPKVDASGIILDYADAHQMNVYMGLWLDQGWYANLDVMDQLAHNLSHSKTDLAQLEKELTGQKSDGSRTAVEIKDAEAEIAVCRRGLVTVQQELDENTLFFAASKDGPLAGPCLAMADSLARIYGHHASFVGWYLPEEIWDAAFSHETIAVLNPLLKFISSHCREVSAPLKRPFAMSPYASRLHYDTAEEIEASQTELLRDTGVDILMLQDSIGDLNLKDDDDISVRFKKHFTAFSKVAASLKIKLWAELESFEQEGKVRKPTNIARFKKQFQYSFPYLDKKDPVYIVYDYLHFLNLLDSKYPDPELRTKLYDDYKREFVDSPFTPPSEKTSN